MYCDIPNYGLRAYALFFSKFGSSQPFRQSDLDFIWSEPMKKKAFSLLVRAGWVRKKDRGSYLCNRPDEIFSHLLDFRVPEAMKEAKKPYAFTGLSAVEIWSDFAYTQRGRERSPYFLKVLGKDVRYWKDFFSSRRIPVYFGKGSFIGEFVILFPVQRLEAAKKGEFFVDSLKETMRQAKENEMHAYAYGYMGRKYGV